MDAIADGSYTSIEAGYGGGRPFPHLEDGLVDGDAPGIGSPVPQPLVDGAMLDDRLGFGWSVVTATPLGPDQLAAAARRDATVVHMDPATMPFLLTPESAVVVRPDRYVAGVANPASNLPAVVARLADNGGYPAG